MILFVAALSMLVAAESAKSATPPILQPLGVAVAATSQAPQPVQPLLLTAKVSITAGNLEETQDATQRAITAVGGRGLHTISRTPQAAFSFAATTPEELRARMKEAVDSLAGLGVVHGYSEEWKPSLLQRTAQISVQLEALKDERAKVAKALKGSPLINKALDAEVARLAAFKADEEPRQGVLNVLFLQESSAADKPDLKDRLKDEHGHDAPESLPK